MPESDSTVAGRAHELASEHAPDLMRKTLHSLLAYANKEGTVILFLQSAAKPKTRYRTLSSSEDTAFDDCEMWATSFAMTKLTPAVEKKIADLVLRAAG